MKKQKRICSVLLTLVLTIAFLSANSLPVSAALKTNADDSQRAAPTASTIMVNGTIVSFDAYTINGSNYFKLRDLAYVLSRTKKQFNVGWDSANSAITITMGAPYITVGGELAKKSTSGKTATLSSSNIYLDKTQIYLTAYTINGNNYFRLRDVAAILDFGVTYNSSTKAISIDTSTGYTEDKNASSVNVEEGIKAALINKTSYLFEISGEFAFEPGANAFRTLKNKFGSITKTQQSEEWTQNEIKGSLTGYIMRIDKGIASVVGNTDATVGNYHETFDCSLTIMEDNKGVSIKITESYPSVNGKVIIGTIKGNMLTASETEEAATYDSFAQVTYGLFCTGEYSVGMSEIPVSNWPPLTPILKVSENDDGSMILTWVDNNPAGVVAYYEIYRTVNVNIFCLEQEKKVATITNRTTWTDSLEPYPADYSYLRLEYRVIAYNAAGVKSSYYPVVSIWSRK